MEINKNSKYKMKKDEEVAPTDGQPISQWDRVLRIACPPHWNCTCLLYIIIFYVNLFLFLFVF